MFFDVEEEKVDPAYLNTETSADFIKPVVQVVEFEYSDGTIQRLRGQAAADWLQEIETAIGAVEVSFGVSPVTQHPWQWSKRGFSSVPREWRRVTRRIYSPFWRAVHNMVAHPLLTIYRPLGEYLHELTAVRMYKQHGDWPPIVSDND